MPNQLETVNAEIEALKSELANKQAIAEDLLTAALLADEVLPKLQALGTEGHLEFFRRLASTYVDGAPYAPIRVERDHENTFVIKVHARLS